MSLESFISLNRVTLSGEVISTPNARSARSGEPYTIFTLAVGPIGPTRPFRISVVAEGSLAERCIESLGRGSAVIVEGALRGAPGRSQALRLQVSRVQYRNEDNKFVDLSLQAPTVAVAAPSVSQTPVVEKEKAPKEPVGARVEAVPTKAKAKKSEKTESTAPSREGFGRTRRPAKPEIPLETLALAETEKEPPVAAKKRPAKKRPSRRRPRSGEVADKTGKTVETAVATPAKKSEVASEKKSEKQPEASTGATAKKKPSRPRRTRKPAGTESRPAGASAKADVKTEAKAEKKTEKKPRKVKKVKKEKSEKVSDSPFALRESESTFDPFLIGSDE